VPTRAYGLEMTRNDANSQRGSPLTSTSGPPGSSHSAGQADLIRHMLDGLSHAQRAELLGYLQRLTAEDFRPSLRIQTARRWVVRFLALCCVVLVPWTIGLGVTLPRHYVAGNWRLAWTGFDVALLTCLSITAWALWRQRQVLVPVALITSVLLLCDAWFDVFTADGHRDLIVSLATALVAEVPLAVLLLLISIRQLHDSVRVARGLEPDEPIAPLWRTHLITVADSPDGAAQFRQVVHGSGGDTGCC
jgi:hypothetical protein